MDKFTISENNYNATYTNIKSTSTDNFGVLPFETLK